MNRNLINFIVILLSFFAIEAFCYKNGFQHALGHIKPQASKEVQRQSVLDLIHRLLPQRFKEFSVEIDTDLKNGTGKDTFKIQKINNSTIKITGSSGVAASTGFHHYLKYFCKAHVSWEASQLVLPADLPDVNISVSLNDRFRYYQNVCTTSYSFVWWNWQQWEKHIDWMALNSFNLVLAFNGQEAIWERVYKKFNLTQENIDEHFSGPAFLSWLRMGNIRGFGSPLSASWHKRSLKLQKKILQRMRNFGIIPVLPAFAGHLPRAFKRIFPDTNMIPTQKWNNFNDSFCCPYFLDPTEDLFELIGKTFIEEQIAEFGTDHVYNCDSFNEVDPASSDLKYLSNVGRSIYSAMTKADPQAIWIMQGWIFVHSMFFWTPAKAKALLTSVPIGKMIILDLQSEQFPQYSRLEQYYGQPYIWCMLHNFGGTLGMFGSVTIINENVIKARNQMNSTMIGTGLTPEGINQNYVVYDLMSESAWRKEPANLTEWFRNYTTRRYGLYSLEADKAWQLLKRSVYDYRGFIKMRGKYAINNSPSLKLNTWKWYEYTDVFDAWDLLIEASNHFKNNPGFLHDLVDVTRQVLQINGDIYYKKLVQAFRKRDLSTFRDVSEIFKGIFSDLEDILATNEAFLLGPWLESSKACADNPKDKDLYEYNARNQISLWGPKGEIRNYASKQWSGVVSNLFHPKWKLFIAKLNDTLVHKVPFNESLVKQLIFTEVEEKFTFDKTLFPTEPKGDTVSVAKKIQKKWISLREKIRKGRSSEEYSEENHFDDTIQFVPYVTVVN